jgi:hypothetical protein
VPGLRQLKGRRTYENREVSGQILVMPLLMNYSNSMAISSYIFLVDLKNGQCSVRDPFGKMRRILGEPPSGHLRRPALMVGAQMVVTGSANCSAFTAVTGHEGGILASICGIFGSRMAQKRLKMGQNRRVPVTHQITR